MDTVNVMWHLWMLWPAMWRRKKQTHIVRAWMSRVVRMNGSDRRTMPLVFFTGWASQAHAGQSIELARCQNEPRTVRAEVIQYYIGWWKFFPSVCLRQNLWLIYMFADHSIPDSAPLFISICLIFLTANVWPNRGEKKMNLFLFFRCVKQLV